MLFRSHEEAAIDSGMWAVVERREAYHEHSFQTQSVHKRLGSICYALVLLFFMDAAMSSLQSTQILVAHHVGRSLVRLSLAMGWDLDVPSCEDVK